MKGSTLQSVLLLTNICSLSFLISRAGELSSSGFGLCITFNTEQREHDRERKNGKNRWERAEPKDIGWKKSSLDETISAHAH